jgi:dsDNA-specific endonuclease/ATPase MutS2
MYRLILELPFQVTLVHRQIFAVQQEAEQFAKQLPQGFRAVPLDALSHECETLTIPVKELKEPMNTREFLRYEEASRQPIVLGDEVYVEARKQRGLVVAISDDDRLTVRLHVDNQDWEEQVTCSGVLRVTGVR